MLIHGQCLTCCLEKQAIGSAKKLSYVLLWTGALGKHILANIHEFTTLVPHYIVPAVCCI